MNLNVIENKDFDRDTVDNYMHPTAIIEEGARIGSNVKIGAFCYIGKDVEIGDNCELKSHVIIEGRTKIGSGNKIYSFAVIGQEPQDLKYEGEKSVIEIGDNNRIREHCTIHPGTKGDNMKTTIGNGNLLMVNTHIAHDCVIANNCVFANNATLAGHVHVGNNVVIGGLSAVHQFVHIGEHAMIGGMTGITKDVIPYGTVVNERSAKLQSLNLIGLTRRNFDKNEITKLRHFYKDVFENDCGNISELIKIASEKYKDSKLIKNIVNFIGDGSKRGIHTVK